MLSFDWFNFICMIINLLILYFLMKKFLFGRVNKILEERKAEIEAGYQKAEEKEKEADKLQEEYQVHLTEITQEKERAARESARKAGEEYERTINEANKKAEDIISKARKTAKYEQERAALDQEKEMRKLVLAAASKINATGESNDNKLYDRFLEKAGNEAAGGDK